ncbi:hypothetical protein [Massilia luteola]|uniref:hypothetical protein n=1 Tax=Massilia luteola TaxID=3081751 RepID=UPI002ACBDABE|nr:hypothetical protein [Massilia sp. Gc5]
MLEGLPHYWINRQTDVERRRLAEAAFARAGVAHARVEAATPDTLPQVNLRKPLANSLPELAIVVSHLRAIGAAHAGGGAAVVVMEDDVRSHHVYDARALMASAPPDWEILQLHVSHAPVVLALGELYLAHGILWHEWEPSFYSAGAYLIRRAAMERLLARYCPDGEHLELGGVHAHGKLVADHLLYRRSICYTATVPLFFNDVALHSTHAPQRDATHHRPGAAGVEAVRRRIADAIAAGRGWPGVPARAGYPFALRPS